MLKTFIGGYKKYGSYTMLNILLNILWKVEEGERERAEAYNGLYCITMILRMNTEASIYREVMSYRQVT